MFSIYSTSEYWLFTRFYWFLNLGISSAIHLLAASGERKWHANFLSEKKITIWELLLLCCLYWNNYSRKRRWIAVEHVPADTLVRNMIKSLSIYQCLVYCYVAFVGLGWTELTRWLRGSALFLGEAHTPRSFLRDSFSELRTITSLWAHGSIVRCAMLSRR